MEWATVQVSVICFANLTTWLRHDGPGSANKNVMDFSVEEVVEEDEVGPVTITAARDGAMVTQTDQMLLL